MKRLLAIAVCLGTLMSAPCARAERVASEYELKAAFLYNFALFTEWPGNDTGALPVCIFGADPFGRALNALYNRSVRERALVVRRPVSLEELKSCRVLFIGAREEARLEAILEAVRGAPVLTVGDGEGFTARGTAIAFAASAQRLAFDVNVGAARAAGLTLSSKLLRLARRVEGGGP